MKSRGRPHKYRLVRLDPKTTQFSPRGRPGRPEQVELGMDEFEALRLADFMGMPQQKAAASMRVSQQTFSRIVRIARKKTIAALVLGAAIKIQGGIYTLTTRETHPNTIPTIPRKPPERYV